MSLDPDACVYDAGMNDAYHGPWPWCTYQWCWTFSLQTNEQTDLEGNSRRWILFYQYWSTHMKGCTRRSIIKETPPRICWKQPKLEKWKYWVETYGRTRWKLQSSALVNVKWSTRSGLDVGKRRVRIFFIYFFRCHKEDIHRTNFPPNLSPAIKASGMGI